MIDVNFDFQKETLDRNGKERDSDLYSPTLREYHRILWAKPLPNGRTFKLVNISNNRLYHNSDMGEFFLSSDWGVATLSGWKRTKALMADIDMRLVDDFDKSVITIGARIIWPSNKIDGLPTINGGRGFNYYIGDRFDLTLECIRRYYLGEESPLFETLKRYGNFFALFEDFKGYVDFFLLQDGVSTDYSSVIIAPPFNDFQGSPVPATVDEYLQYMAISKDFISKRNNRIAEYACV